MFFTKTIADYIYFYATNVLAVLHGILNFC